jgi:hypothetical protein
MIFTYAILSTEYDFIGEVGWNIDTHEDNFELPAVEGEP